MLQMKKSLIKQLVGAGMLLLSAQLYAMEGMANALGAGENAGGGEDHAVAEAVVRRGAEVMRNVGRDVVDVYNQHQIRARENFEGRIRGLMEQARDNRLTREQRRDALTQANRLRDQQMQAEQAWNNAGAQFAQQAGQIGLNLADGIFKDEIARRGHLRDKELTAIKAVQERKATVEAATARINAITTWVKGNPKFMIGLTAGICLAGFGTYHAVKLAANRLDKDTPPSLAEETSLLSRNEQLFNWITGKPVKDANLKDVVLKKDLADLIDELAESLKFSIQNGGFLRNVLFWGPPGTGKTMVAQRLARSCGLEYIYFSASNLETFTIETALAKIAELDEFSKNTNKGLMIIIDEAEGLLGDRRRAVNQTDKKLTLLTRILTLIGTESRKVMVVALSNLPENLDDAFISRCDDQIEIGIPDVPERKGIIKRYFEKYLVKGEQMKIEPSTGWANWFFGLFSSQAAAPAALKFEAGVLEGETISPQLLDRISNRLEGHNFVGRDISKMVNQIQNSAYATKDCSVSNAVIDRVINRKIAEKIAKRQNFGRGAAPAGARVA